MPASARRLGDLLSDPPWPYPSYDKIASSLERWVGDDTAAMRALRSASFVVTEKIHGANLCIASDGEQVKVGKRKEWLAPHDPFFGYRRAIDPLHDNVRALAAALGARTFVYGELFGGGYPHPDVEPVSGLLPVQTGVWYAPDLAFLAFDVRVLEGERYRWLAFDEARERLSEAGIGAVMPLMRGIYADAIAFALGFDSTIPARLGLPALAEGSNPAEGVVITPAAPVAVRGRLEPLRPVIKRKLPAFEEDARFHKAKAAPDVARIEGALPSLMSLASDLACEPRLDAAVSKLGRVEDVAAASAVRDTLAADILDALSEAEPVLLRSLDPVESAALSDHIRGESSALVEICCGFAPRP